MWLAAGLMRVGFTSEIRASDVAPTFDHDDDTADAADPRELNNDAIAEGLLMTRDDLFSCWLGIFEARPAAAFDDDLDAGASGAPNDFNATAEGLLLAIIDERFPWRSRGEENSLEKKKGRPSSELEVGLSRRYM